MFLTTSLAEARPPLLVISQKAQRIEAQVKRCGEEDRHLRSSSLRLRMIMGTKRFAFQLVHRNLDGVGTVDYNAHVDWPVASKDSQSQGAGDGMNWFKKSQFREWLIKEAESNEHRRLKERLGQWAVSKGYSEAQIAFESGVEPDVLRLNAEGPLLFVGDAKNFATEPASRLATRRRLAQYFRKFAGALEAKIIKGGTLAVATNSEKGAQEWVAELNAMAFDHGLTNAENGPPSFNIDKIDDRTFVVFW
jgi:hypothetical protein